MLNKANRHGRRSSFPAIGENGFARLVDSRVIPVCPQTPLDLESTESPDDGDTRRRRDAEYVVDR